MWDKRWDKFCGKISQGESENQQKQSSIPSQLARLVIIKQTETTTNRHSASNKWKMTTEKQRNENNFKHQMLQTCNSMSPFRIRTYPDRAAPYYKNATKFMSFSTSRHHRPHQNTSLTCCMPIHPDYALTTL